jgi:hypothetical protein
MESTMKKLLATAATLVVLCAPAFADHSVLFANAQGTVTFTELEVGCHSLENTLDQPQAYRMAANRDPRYDCQFLDKDAPIQVQRIASSDAWPKTYSALCVVPKRQTDKFGREISQTCFWVIVEKTKHSVAWN